LLGKPVAEQFLFSNSWQQCYLFLLLQAQESQLSLCTHRRSRGGQRGACPWWWLPHV